MNPNSPCTAHATAYSYVRFSSRKQEEGDSIRRQMKMAQDYCDRMGYRLDNSLRQDRGVSAYRGKNVTKGALGDFLAKIAAGKISPPDILVVENLDRLTQLPHGDL